MRGMYCTSALLDVVNKAVRPCGPRCGPTYGTLLFVLLAYCVLLPCTLSLDLFILGCRFVLLTFATFRRAR